MDQYDHIPVLAARRMVAAAIVKQAAVDLLNPTVSEKERQDAEKFLSDPERYTPVAKIAGLGPTPPLKL